MNVASPFIPCGEYLPDQADYQNAGTSVAQNVVPRTTSTFSPMPSFAVSATSALNSQPLGAFSAVDKTGAVANYAGTTTKLYTQTNGTKPNFADTSGSVYAVPQGNFWNFAEVDGQVYATNGSDAVQTVATASGGNFAAVSDTNTPKARYVAFIQPGFLILGDIVDVTVGTQPQGVRWSALGNAASFPLVGSAAAIAASSDWQKIAGPHGRMMGFAPNLASCAAAVFFQQAVFRMVFTGGTTIFAFQPVETVRGTPSPRAITQVGQTAFFLANNGFFAFNGTSAVPIGEGKVNKTFFTDADPNYLNQVSAVADPVSGLIFWSYAGVGNSNGVPNRILIYNPYINRWALITDPTGSSLFLARTLGTSLDGIDALGFNLDTLPYNLDSDFLAGGNIVIGGFDTSFKFGSFVGANMAFTVDTSEVQLTPGGRSRVSGIRPIVEGDICSAAIGARNLLSDAVAYGTAVAQDSTGLCAVRSDARYHRARLSRPAGNLVTHIKGAEVGYVPGPRR